MFTDALAALLPLLLPALEEESPSVAADWLELDRELSSLAAGLQEDEGAPVLGGRIIATYAFADDLFFTGGGPDISGFNLRSVRPEVTGGVGDYSYMISFDGSGGTFTLVDAYVEWPCGDDLSLRMGRYKRPFLYSGMVSSKRLLFFDRNNNAGQNDGRDVGVMAHGRLDDFDLYASAQNGTDGQADDMLLVGRLEYALLGDPFDKYEGAWGQGKDMHLGVAAAFQDDAGLQNGTVFGLETEVGNGAIWLHADLASYDEDYDRTAGVPNGIDPDEILGVSKANTDPYGVTLSFLFGDQEYEAAARIEEFDDVDDTTRFQLGLNWYQQGLGHDKKWQLIYTEVGSQNDAFDGARIEVGLVLVF